MFVLLQIGGHETTTNLIGNGLLALLQNSEEMQKLKDNPSVMETAVEEFLRSIVRFNPLGVLPWKIWR